MLGAFAISFYFTANTIIYYLMRHEVDATELDDVYLEQSEEDFVRPGGIVGSDNLGRIVLGHVHERGIHRQRRPG